MVIRRILRFLFDSALILVAGSFLATCLLRWAPGADVDGRELTPGMSAGTVAALRAERAHDLSFTGQSFGYFTAALRGDLGKSTLTGVPVTELLTDRAAPTAKTVLAGASLGLLVSICTAALAVLWLRGSAELICSAAFLAVLSVPAGLLVLLAIFGRVPVEIAVAATVAPRGYFYAARLLSRERATWYVVNATAAGIGRLRIALFHVVPVLRPELAALAGFALVSALAATIPAEVLSGKAGIGQLAWKSAMERDLPVLVGVTMCMIVVARAVTLLTSLGQLSQPEVTAQ